MSTIKVFNVDDHSWFAASTMEEAKAAAQAEFGYSDEDAAEFFEDASEVSQESMTSMRFRDEDGTTRTFAEQLQREIDAGTKFPCLFAMKDC